MRGKPRWGNHHQWVVRADRHESRSPDPGNEDSRHGTSAELHRHLVAEGRDLPVTQALNKFPRLDYDFQGRCQ